MNYTNICCINPKLEAADVPPLEAFWPQNWVFSRHLNSFLFLFKALSCLTPPSLATQVLSPLATFDYLAQHSRYLSLFLCLKALSPFSAAHYLFFRPPSFCGFLFCNSSTAKR